MALDVAIYQIARHKRSAECCAAMLQGIRASGDRATIIPEESYIRPTHDVAVFYGYTKTLQGVKRDYNRLGRRIVYIDLGYWDRVGLRSHHKIVVDARHPTKYFQQVKHPSDRADKLRVRPHEWRRDGSHILLAGMGDKAASVEGLTVESYERQTIAELKRHTARRIIYRPKPSWLGARPLPGADYSDKNQIAELLFYRCHAVVSHHSNLAVEGLVNGVPAFVVDGVALPQALTDLSKIESPLMRDDRQQWINDIAYTQWNIAEMHAGLPWRHLKDERMIP